MEVKINSGGFHGSWAHGERSLEYGRYAWIKEAYSNDGTSHLPRPHIHVKSTNRTNLTIYTLPPHSHGGQLEPQAPRAHLATALRTPLYKLRLASPLGIH